MDTNMTQNFSLTQNMAAGAIAGIAVGLPKSHNSSPKSHITKYPTIIDLETKY
jgi:hypothetical protein